MHLRTLPERIDQLATAGLLRLPDDRIERRRLEARHPAPVVDLSSNDYLGLSGCRSSSVSRETADPGVGAAGDVSRETASAPGAPGGRDVSRETPRWGAGSSRLLHGTDESHLEVERQVAAWVRQPASLLFASGYAANVGALAALLDPEDCVISDALNHASLIDGIRLSRARPSVVRHLDLADVERALRAGVEQPARWVVTESYFSMDGDGPDLAALRALCDRYDAHLYVDEAHAVGVFGPSGGGRLAAAGVAGDVVLAAFGKAVGAQGACVASSEGVRTWLWNRARSFVFSTGISPVLAHGLSLQLARARSADAARGRLESVTRGVREGLALQGWPLPHASFGPIVSLVVGKPERAVELARAAESLGLIVQAIRPPTVPEGGARIRLTLHADLNRADIERLLQYLAPFAPAGGASA